VLSRSALKYILILSIFLLSACDEQILHDLSESEANRVISRFSGTAIIPTKVVQSDGRWAIAVPRESSVSALAFLDSHRVLSARGGKGPKAAKGGLVPSREEQWFSYQRAVAQSIEDTLNSLGGVLEAHVHVNLPEHDPLLGRKRDAGGTGSVLLVIDDRFAVKDEEVSALVSGAAGLPAGSVTVLRSIAARNSGSVAEQDEPSVVALVAPSVTAPVVSSEALGPELPKWLSLQIAYAAMGSFVCGTVGVIAVRRRTRRKRTRFSLPVESHEE
jgi:flagellar biosynthesis/type III secretory pathway M-ring protein FliF/YscJ